MEWHQALVAQAIDREAVRLSLAPKIGAEIPAVVAFVAARTGKIELAVARVIELVSLRKPRRHRPVDTRVDRHAAGLETHKGGHCGQFRRAEFPRRSLHPLAAADVDLLLQIDGLVKRFAP